jgi:hypothetical protein
MATNFPTSADDSTSLPDPTASSYTNAPSHAGLHANANAAIKAIEAKIGIGASTPPGGGYIFTSSSNGTSSWQAAPAAGVWGLITGTLSSQTDLQTALNAKLALAGGTMTGLLVLSADPSALLGAATKQYVDALGSTTLVRNETPGGLVNGSNTAYTTSSTFATGSLKVYLNGQRLAPGSGIDYVEVTQGFTMQYAPATGDVLLVDYETTNTTRFVQGTNSYIVQETPTGLVNSSNTLYTTSQVKYVANTLEVYINGLLQSKTTDYTETSPGSGTFTMVVAPTTGDDLRVAYQFATGSSGNADTVDGVHASPTGGSSGSLIADYLGGWWSMPVALTYVTANTATAPGDITGWIQLGDKVLLTQTTAKYFYVTAISYSSGTGLTTVTLFAGSTYTLANAAITAPYYSKIENPQGFPHWFAITAPTWANITSPTNSEFRFKIASRTVFLHSRSSGTKSGTDNNLNFPFFTGLPALANSTTRTSMGVAHVVGGGIGDATASITYISGSIYVITSSNMTNASSLTDVTLNMNWEF